MMSLWIDQKYLNLLSGKLDRFTQKSNNLYNFRCPYCGDSQKNKFKARGYVYEKKGGLFYKCHNCSVGTHLRGLLDHVDPSLGDSYGLENFREGKGKNIRRMAPDMKTELDFKPKFRTKHGTYDFLRPLLDSDNPALEYAKNRKLPVDRLEEFYWIEDVQSLESVDPRYEGRILGNEPRLVIPFYDIKGNLFAFQARAIDDNPLRYITIKIKENHPLVFNLNKVNFNEKVYVTEGPFDSLFLPNSIAVGGIDLTRILVSNAAHVLVFDNQPRNKELVKLIEKVCDQTEVVIWPKNIEQKDINEMILDGFTTPKILDIINQNTFNGLSARNALAHWKKC